MLEKILLGETITVGVDGVLEYRKQEQILEDGVVLAETNWRAAYDPLTDTTQWEEYSKLRMIAEAAWTPNVKQAWRDKLAAEAEAEAPVEPEMKE